MKKYVSLILTIIWMIIIFMMSSASSSESNEQSGRLVTFIAGILNISNLDTLNFVIRKIAHITEFGILGLLVTNLIHSFNKKTYIAVIICILYAISDEIHQYFVPGRNAQVIDILIDSVGCLLGIYFFNLFIKVINIYKNKKIIC